jgi:G protein beta subunit-like protein
MGFVRKYLLPRTCEHSFSISGFDFVDWGAKTPAGDVPIRSVSLAADGSFLVAGNNKVYMVPQPAANVLRGLQGNCYVWKVNDESSGLPRFQAVTKFHAHNKYLTRCLLSPDAK